MKVGLPTFLRIKQRTAGETQRSEFSGLTLFVIARRIQSFDHAGPF
jgi:hypothetical protein